MASNNSRYPDIDLAAAKALVTIYGPREAARVSGVPFGTISAWCFKYKWKKANLKLRDPTRGKSKMNGKDAADVIRDTLENAREQSTLNLARFTEKASKAAVKHKDPLSVARRVKDVASVYKTLWPPESGSDLIEGAILIGAAPVTDNPDEVFSRAKEVEGSVVSDVREELPDNRPAGD